MQHGSSKGSVGAVDLHQGFCYNWDPQMTARSSEGRDGSACCLHSLVMFRVNGQECSDLW